MDDAIVVELLFFSGFFVFGHKLKNCFSLDVCQEATTKTWARSTDSADGLEEETEELGSELHLPSSFWGDNHGESRAVWRQRVGTSSWATESFSPRSSRGPSRAGGREGGNQGKGSRITEMAFAKGDVVLRSCNGVCVFLRILVL